MGKTTHRRTTDATCINFQKILEKNHEDLRLIETIEDDIGRLRPYIFRLPKQGEPVILLLSGGLDSVIAWEKLLGEYHLQVFPITVYKKTTEPQQRSIRYFSALFKNKYPKLYHDPFAVNSTLLDKQLYELNAKKYFDPKTILKQYNPSLKNSTSPYSGTNAFTAINGAIYAQYLQLTRGVSIHTIIYGATADDGLFISSQTYAFMRVMMRMLMMFVQDTKLQLGSIYYEQSLAANEKKRDVLKYGYKQNLPLEKTYSCGQGGWLHCGRCPSCIGRQYCFSINNIPDRTIYLNQIPSKGFARKVLGRIKRLLIFPHKDYGK
jgi:7-cyano-7-deazaguanine synthase in queuosine biosynthesis